MLKANKMHFNKLKGYYVYVPKRDENHIFKYRLLIKDDFIQFPKMFGWFRLLDVFI